MTRGKWLLLGFGVVLVTSIAAMRFWIGPAWAISMTRLGRSTPPSVSTTRWGVLLFNNPITANTRTRIRFLVCHSSVLLMEHQPEAAVDYSERALELGEKLAPADFLNQIALGITMQALAMANKPARAAAVVNRWLSRTEERLSKDHPSLIRPLTLAAQIAEQSDQPDLAQTLAERAVAIILKRSTPYDRALLPPLEVLQRVAMAKKNWDSAMRFAEQLKEVEKREGQTDPAVVEWRHAQRMRRLAELNSDDEKAYEFCLQIVSRADELARAGKIGPAEAVNSVGPAVRFARKIGRSDEAIAWTERMTQLPGFEEKVQPTTRAYCYLTILEDLIGSARYSRTKEFSVKCFAAAEKLNRTAAQFYLERINKLAATCSERGHAQLAQELRSHAERIAKEKQVPTTTSPLTSPPSMFLPTEPPPPFGAVWGM